MSGGRLLHTEGVAALLDDYVFFSDALLAAYEVTGAVEYLEKARLFMDRCLEKFRDEEGGFFDTEEEVVGMRLKSIEDIPHPFGQLVCRPRADQAFLYMRLGGVPDRGEKYSRILFTHRDNARNPRRLLSLCPGRIFQHVRVVS